MALVIVLGAGSLACPPAIADTGAADPYVDQLAEAAETPTLGWADCGDGFLCATAEVPLDYNRPRDEQIELAVIKLPATDPQNRIGTLFINFGGPGQSGVDRLRGRARWPWLFSEELRSRFDLVSWDQRGVARSAAVRCFPDAAEQWRFLVPSPGLPMDAHGEQELFAWSKEFADRCEQRAGPILNHASSANTARDLELLRRAVGDPSLTYHGISYGTQLGAIYANLFPGRVRAMVLDGSIDFQGNADGTAQKEPRSRSTPGKISLPARPRRSRSSCGTVRRPVSAARSPQEIPGPNGRRWPNVRACHLLWFTATRGPTRRWLSQRWRSPPLTLSWPSCCNSFPKQVPRRQN